MKFQVHQNEKGTTEKMKRFPKTCFQSKKKKQIRKKECAIYKKCSLEEFAISRYNEL
jgi:hypothetical protein